MTIKQKPTLKTISELLGISKTTVSLVLKGDGDRYRISKKTQDKITDCAKELGFKPDFLARALATKKTSTIGIILPDVHESFMSEMIRGVESVLYEAGYSIMLSTSGFNYNFELRNIEQMIHRKVDGIIIAPYVPIADTSFSHDYLSELEKADCPVIFIDRIPPKNTELNWIIQDDYLAAFSAVKLLHDKGCRNIGCLSFNLDISSINNRIRGYTDAIESVKLRQNLIMLEEQNSDSDDLYLKLKSNSESETPFDGLIITTGGIADKVSYIRKTGDFGSGNIEIVKFGKDPQYFNSGMIQIIQPTTRMGQLAAESILKRIEDPDGDLIQIKVKSNIKEGNYEEK